MNQVKNKQLYFSSSQDEDIPIPQSMMNEDIKKPRTRREEIMDDNINELSGLEVFEMFCSPKQLSSLMKSEEAQSAVIIRFFWRIHYIIGEIVLQVQQLLVDENKLSFFLPLRDSQIDRIAFRLISQAQKGSLEPEFTRIKNQLLAIYKNTHFDLSALIELYKYFVKESCEELKFQMVLRFDRRPSFGGMDRSQNYGKVPVPYQVSTSRRLPGYVPNPNPEYRNNMAMSATDPRIGQYSVVRMPQERQFQDQTQPYSNLRGIMNGKDQALLNPVQSLQTIQKGISSKWSTTEQAIFCKIYSQQESPAVCAQLMQQKVGSDGRWKSANQIQLKMYSLVQKVFKKFSTLNTNNEYIKKFRSQKELILNMPDPLIKKKIFRNIAIIYQSMLNVSEEKKAVISQKILEVNRLCKDATLINR